MIKSLTPTESLLFRMADDALIIGHRNSEWVGLGPILEEDIAFASIAQDKIGHAHNLYIMLHQHFSAPEPDTTAFMRNAEQFYSCQFVEYPIGGFEFSIMRQFLFDNAEYLRYSMLVNSSFTPLAQFAKKVRGEIKYHVLHGNTWISQLAPATEEANSRLQQALNTCFPLALGIFEQQPSDAELIEQGVFEGEHILQQRWLEAITPILEKAELIVPDIALVQPAYGGRTGNHSEHLQPLLDEMTEVFAIDPTAEW